MPLPTTDTRTAAIFCAMLMAMWLAIQVAGPDALGISPVAYRWLGILAAGIAVCQGFLPSIKPSQPDAADLADAISRLSVSERAEVRAMVDKAHGRG